MSRAKRIVKPVKWWEGVSEEDMKIFKKVVKKLEIKELVEAWMTEYWGKKCSEKMKGCPLCKAWECFDYIFED